MYLQGTILGIFRPFISERVGRADTGKKKNRRKGQAASEGGDGLRGTARRLLFRSAIKRSSINFYGTHKKRSV